MDCSGCAAKERTGLAKAAALPTPNKRAKLRREMDIVFMRQKLSSNRIVKPIADEYQIEVVEAAKDSR